MGSFWEGAEVISVVTRGELLDEGALVDVSKVARDLFSVHTAVTRRVWEEVVVPPEPVAGIQDEYGRLWDVLWMLKCKVSRLGKEVASELDTVLFEVLVVNDYEHRDEQLVTLKGVISGGDEGEAVLTILMPEED
jgi:hypothetical protein